MKKSHLITVLWGYVSLCLYAGLAQAQQTPNVSIRAKLGRSNSAVTHQTSKRFINTPDRPTQIPSAQRNAPPIKVYKTLKSIKPKKVNPDRSRSSAAKFAEVEILLNDRFSIDYISDLPKAPGSDFEILDNPGRVRAQLPAGKVKALIEKNAEINVLRKFVLVEPATVKNAASNSDAARRNSSQVYCFGENDDDVYIPDDGYGGAWAWSDIPISCAPSDCTVNSIDVHYEIFHTYTSDLVVVLSDYQVTNQYLLWYYQDAGSYFINETEIGITTFNGMTVNQTWTLWATDDYFGDVGYIDYWWIKVYYQDVSSEYYMQADSYFENTTQVSFPYYFHPGTVCFSLSPECGSLDPPCDEPVYQDGYFWASTNYTPCEDECTSVDITAHSPLGSDQTKTINLDDRYHIGCCFPKELCVATYDVDTGVPSRTWVTSTVIPQEAGAVDPCEGWSQLEPGSGQYVLCSTYTPACCYTGRVRVKFRIDNTPSGPDDNDGILIYSLEQDPAISPSTNWQTISDSFCEEEWHLNEYQVYKMLLNADANYDFTLCQNDGVGASCDGDGDLEMFDASCTRLWYIDGDPTCDNDASTLGTEYESWSPPSDGYYYLVVSDYFDEPMSYTLSYRKKEHCLKQAAPEYSDWIFFGKPDCWCYPHHCQGDIDGKMQFGMYWVFTDDLDIFKDNFAKKSEDIAPGGICADIDHHIQFGMFRVFTSDLDIFKLNFGRSEDLLTPPECDPNNYNFWTSP